MQFGLQPLRAVRLTGAHMGGLDRHVQPRILLGACRGAAGAPGIVATSRHLQHSTQQTQRILGTQRAPERVPGRGAFATYAVALFRMSRSIRASARSRMSRDNSASSSVTGRRLAPTVASWPCRARPTQFLSVLPDILRRRTASRIGNCCSRTSRTACSRNSVVYPPVSG